MEASMFDYKQFHQLEETLQGYSTLDEYGFYRKFVFTALGVTYSIEWWTNQSYLFINDVQVLFNSVKIDGCWPNRYKKSLVLKQNDQVVAIIPLEEY